MKYIFIDIDGTLLSHHTNTVPKSAIEAIHRAKKNGHKVFICTGRARNEIPEQVINISFDGLICSCGAMVLVNDEVIHLKTIPHDLLISTVRLLEDNKVGFNIEGINHCFLDEITYNLFTGAFSIGKNDSREEASKLLQAQQMLPFEGYKKLEENSYLKLSTFSHSVENCLYVKKHLHPSFDYILHIEDDRSTMQSGEMLYEDSTKSSGIKHVLNYFRGNACDTIAIGDSRNDIDMLLFCDIGIAMGNAIEELKEISDYVSDDVDNDGIYNALAAFNLI